MVKRPTCTEIAISLLMLIYKKVSFYAYGSVLANTKNCFHHCGQPETNVFVKQFQHLAYKCVGLENELMKLNFESRENEKVSKKYEPLSESSPFLSRTL